MFNIQKECRQVQNYSKIGKEQQIATTNLTHLCICLLKYPAENTYGLQNSIVLAEDAPTSGFSPFKNRRSKQQTAVLNIKAAFQMLFSNWRDSL